METSALSVIGVDMLLFLVGVRLWQTSYRYRGYSLTNVKAARSALMMMGLHAMKITRGKVGFKQEMWHGSRVC
jgi:hypothetical protein